MKAFNIKNRERWEQILHEYIVELFYPIEYYRLPGNVAVSGLDKRENPGIALEEK